MREASLRASVPRPWRAARAAGLLGLVVAMTLASARAQGYAEPPAAQGNGQIRVVHAVPDLPALDLLLDGARVWSGLGYGAESGYLIVPAGRHTLALVAAGTTPAAPLAATEVVVAAGQAVTAIANGAGEPLLLEDLGLAPVGGPALVRLAHVAPRLPPLELASEDGPPLVTSVPAGAASPYVETAPAALTLVVRVAADRTPLARLPGAVLVADRAYTFVALAAPGGERALTVLPLVDAPGTGLTACRGAAPGLC